MSAFARAMPLLTLSIKNLTYSIFPTDKFGILRRTSGGFVVLLLEAVLVPVPAVAVAFVALDTVAPAEDDTDVMAGSDAVEDAVCAAENVKREHSESSRNP